jgi:hypothetical protein
LWQSGKTIAIVQQSASGVRIAAHRDPERLLWQQQEL